MEITLNNNKEIIAEENITVADLIRIKNFTFKLLVTKVNGQPTTLPRWTSRFEALPDGSVRELPEVHGLYRNEGGGRFKAIQFEPGTFLDAEGKPVPPYRGWGLSVMFRDLNGDGAPDLMWRRQPCTS